MPLNMKDLEVQRLAEEVAAATGESKTEAIRQALLERKARLRTGIALPEPQGMRWFLEREIWSRLPREQLGGSPDSAQRERTLGYRQGGRLIVDAAAMLAIVFQEPGYEDLLYRIAAAPAVVARTPALMETASALDVRLGAGAHRLLERLLDRLGIQEVRSGNVRAEQLQEPLSEVPPGHPTVARGQERIPTVGVLATAGFLKVEVSRSRGRG